jgi:hypothetical protein
MIGDRGSMAQAAEQPRWRSTTTLLMAQRCGNNVYKSIRPKTIALYFI